MFAIVSWILSCKNRWMYVQANEFLARKARTAASSLKANM